MIIQITIARNELFLIKKLLPIWKKYADGFVFLLDTCDDGTKEYLEEVKGEYNILNIISMHHDHVNIKDKPEYVIRQFLFDKGRSYSEKIICLDADEYLDGNFTKEDLESILNCNENTVFFLRWYQYISKNKIRVDEPWRNNYKDRMGFYNSSCKIDKRYKHTTHLPIPQNQKIINNNDLFIAHLSWLDKKYSAIKQYFWKIEDYVYKKKFNVETINMAAYDQSVNNFNWEEEEINFPLKIDLPLEYNHWRLKIIKEWTEQYQVPNLGDWGYDILNMEVE